MSEKDGTCPQGIYTNAFYCHYLTKTIVEEEIERIEQRRKEEWRSVKEEMKRNPSGQQSLVVRDFIDPNTSIWNRPQLTNFSNKETFKSWMSLLYFGVFGNGETIKVWRNKVATPEATVHVARQQFCEWRHAKAKTNHVMQNPRVLTRWTPPQTGVVKCNVDATIFIENSSYRYDLCVRNEEGDFIKAKSGWSHGKPLSVEAEALAIL
ncbi:hypothetical protein Fmac_012522 [Flemingia macrophylla]|uniref:RNase H type-1 domain-containing protein n=1 Tax=Flemingia macrophylla TaxID=520843 RepID=A0ABD1MQJ1_9FABA